MSISAIICSYGTERLNDVTKAVNSILRSSHSGFEAILVIDKNETFYRDLQGIFGNKIKIIESNKKGLSNARNIGIKYSKNEIIAFLDDDAIADENWLKVLENDFKEPNIVAIGGKIEPLFIDGRPYWFPEELDWIVGCTYKGHPEEKCYVRNVIGCNMAFRKEVFNKIGMFEANIGRVGKKLLAGEEMELCVRISRKISGARILYDPNLKVQHKVYPYRQTFYYTLVRAYNEGLSKAIVVKMHDSKTSNRVLSTENHYLKYIFTISISRRLKEILHGKALKKNISQTVVIILTMGMVSLGYLIGKIGGRKPRK